jgi:hypothetical protein
VRSAERTGELIKVRGVAQVPVRPGRRRAYAPVRARYASSGVQGLDSFKAFVAGAEDRHVQPATFTQPELIGDYRTFDDPDRPRRSQGREATRRLWDEFEHPRQLSELGVTKEEADVTLEKSESQRPLPAEHRAA